MILFFFLLFSSQVGETQCAEDPDTTAERCEVVVGRVVVRQVGEWERCAVDQGLVAVLVLLGEDDLVGSSFA